MEMLGIVLILIAVVCTFAGLILAYREGRLFCKHEWEVVSEHTTSSKFERAMKVARENGATNPRIPWQLSTEDRKFIQIVKCTKCGKLKRFVENI